MSPTLQNSGQNNVPSSSAATGMSIPVLLQHCQTRLGGASIEALIEKLRRPYKRKRGLALFDQALKADSPQLSPHEWSIELLQAIFALLGLDASFGLEDFRRAIAVAIKLRRETANAKNMRVVEVLHTDVDNAKDMLEIPDATISIELTDGSTFAYQYNPTSGRWESTQSAANWNLEETEEEDESVPPPSTSAAPTVSQPTPSLSPASVPSQAAHSPSEDISDAEMDAAEPKTLDEAANDRATVANPKKAEIVRNWEVVMTGVSIPLYGFGQLDVFSVAGGGVLYALCDPSAFGSLPASECFLRHVYLPALPVEAQRSVVEYPCKRRLLAFGSGTFVR